MERKGGRGKISWTHNSWRSVEHTTGPTQHNTQHTTHSSVPLTMRVTWDVAGRLCASWQRHHSPRLRDSQQSHTTVTNLLLPWDLLRNLPLNQFTGPFWWRMEILFQYSQKNILICMTAAVLVGWKVLVRAYLENLIAAVFVWWVSPDKILGGSVYFWSVC